MHIRYMKMLAMFFLLGTSSRAVYRAYEAYKYHLNMIDSEDIESSDGSDATMYYNFRDMIALIERSRVLLDDLECSQVYLATHIQSMVAEREALIQHVWDRRAAQNRGSSVRKMQSLQYYLDVLDMYIDQLRHKQIAEHNE